MSFGLATIHLDCGGTLGLRGGTDSLTGAMAIVSDLLRLVGLLLLKVGDLLAVTIALPAVVVAVHQFTSRLQRRGRGSVRRVQAAGWVRCRGLPHASRAFRRRRARHPPRVRRPMRRKPRCAPATAGERDRPRGHQGSSGSPRAPAARRPRRWIRRRRTPQRWSCGKCAPEGAG